MEIANDLKSINLRSLKRVKDGIKDGDIPNWLLMELFIRLPQKVVFRFKLVSKQWLSIISDPSFVKMYCSRAFSIQKLQPWTFVLNSRSFHPKKRTHFPEWELLVDMYSSNLKWPNLNELPLPCFPHEYWKCYKIYEISDGLVLYGPQKITTDLNCRICNPLTGQWIALPPLGCCQKIYNLGFMTNVEYGVLMSYTVVRLLGHAPFNGQSKLNKFEVFLSEVGEWKTYNVSIDIAIEFTSSCVVLNGVMHWMLCDEQGLIAYDPRKCPDQVHSISLPVDKKDRDFRTHWAAYHGLLRYFKLSGYIFNTSTFESFNIWVLSDYNSGVWCLQHRVNYTDVQFCTALSGGLFIKPMSFHPYDSDIVYLVYGTTIITYNIHTKKLEASENFGQVKAEELHIFAAHLFVIPPWPVSLSRPLPMLQRNS